MIDQQNWTFSFFIDVIRREHVKNKKLKSLLRVMIFKVEDQNNIQSERLYRLKMLLQYTII